MPPSPRNSVKMQEALFSFTSSIPRASWLRRVLCSHLRYLWLALTAFTVVCVAFQIIGIALQSRNDKVNEWFLALKYRAELRRPLTMFRPNQEGLSSTPLLAHERGVRSSKGEELQRKRAGGSHAMMKPPLLPACDATTKQQDERPFEFPKVSNKTTIKDVLLDSPKEKSIVLTGELAPLEDNLSRVSRLEMGGPGHAVSRPQRELSDGPSNRSQLESKADKRLTAGGEPGNVNHLESKVPTGNGVHDSKGICQPKNNIVFLKTHKTASSTILNMLYRYGDRRNLTFALPLNQHSQLFYPYYFASYFVEGFSSRRVTEFNIMCNHMRFRKTEVEKVMPKDTFYFSILRHPVSMMESIFTYYKKIPTFHNSHNLSDFLDRGWRDFNLSRINNHYARNLLAYDFGFDSNVGSDTKDLEDRAWTAIAGIEQDFHLILISEYFDESMVLLKHALCWSLDDIVSFKLNSRSQLTRHQLLPQTADKILAWNALDWRLYFHFNATFWKKVDTLVGREEMAREVSHLRERRDQLERTCLQDGRAVDPWQIKDSGLKPFQSGAAIIQGYNLKPGLEAGTRINCQSLITPELQYTGLLYKKQFPELSVGQSKVSQKVALRQQKPGSNQAMIRKMHHRSTVKQKVLNITNRKGPASIHSKHLTIKNSRNMP